MDFINDKEKMKNFLKLPKDEFLKSYSYLTEDEYIETQLKINSRMKKIPLEELLSSKTQNKTRQLDDNMHVIDIGYRNKEPIALVEKTTKCGKEYIIGFNYEITDNKIQWGYGYYYDTDITKAKNDFKKVLEGGNLADTFKENKKEERVMENDSNELQFYNETEIRNIITNKDELYVVDDEIAEVIIKFEDIAYFIVDTNRKKGVVNLNFYKIGGDPYQPDIATKGEFIKKINPKIRENISDRLIKLQTGKIQLKEYKLIDERKFIKVKRKMEQEMKKSKTKEKDKEMERKRKMKYVRTK